ncbi:MAG: hypothetical protein KDB03_14520 [Planctomycetales bacterium]|nr:hypothetical protein [Planctomycetales bacterium]
MFDLLFLIAVELSAIAVAVEFLANRIPPEIRKAAQENCFRLEGSPSRSRTRKENKAKFKLRADLWAGFLIVAFLGNGLLLFVHSFVMPLDLGVRIVATISGSPIQARERILSEGYDVAYQRWSRSEHGSSREDATRNLRILWRLWPAFLAGGILFGVALLVGLRSVHGRALKDYSDGLAYRQEQNLNRDLARIQDAAAPVPSVAGHLGAD